MSESSEESAESASQSVGSEGEGNEHRDNDNDKMVIWEVSWKKNVQVATKCFELSKASKLKVQKDLQKYETARTLHIYLEGIRAQYQEDWKSTNRKVRQRGVALYFIDELSLRAGNKKKKCETADRDGACSLQLEDLTLGEDEEEDDDDDEEEGTVGCCSLRVEHITLHKDKEKVYLDFPGKGSIRYKKPFHVEKQVFKNLQDFMANKKPCDDLFEELNTTFLNKPLKEKNLTAKVFRTFNASCTFSKQLRENTPDDDQAAKLQSYDDAHRKVAELLNHWRAVPKTPEKSMENRRKTDESKILNMETSKLYYLDPRITVAWCKKFNVPIGKVYTKAERHKFRWAILMDDEDFVF